MKRISLMVSVIILTVLMVSGVKAQSEGWFSLSRFTTDISISYGGDYALEGNEGGVELISVLERDQNTAEGSLLGGGFALNYRIIKGLEAFYSWHYEYGNEELVETLAFIMKDYGLRYSFYQVGALRPFVKLAYARFKMDALKLYDVSQARPSYNPTFEDDFNGAGIRYGIGIDLKISETLTYSLGYNGFSVSSFEGAASNRSNVSFENTPEITTYRLSVRITF